MAIILGLLGLIVGSFIGALTWRWPQKISLLRPRSFCPYCQQQIAWYDNIPVVSFLFLRAKCRRCHKPISFRYPLIEVLTAVFFIFVGQNISLMTTNLTWTKNLGVGALFFYLIISFCLVALFVTDLETLIVPDSLVLLGFLVGFLALVISGISIYLFLLASFAAASFLLLINLLTKGQGMGLGDVKLALFLGLPLGKLVFVWFFWSFLIGALVGCVLLVLGKTKFGKKIAFAPFLIIGFIITSFWSNFLI
jgi:leader peptidase (prepilin peptidase)/N-methyltransferase